MGSMLTLDRRVGTGVAAAVVLVVLGGCGFGSDPPTQDIGGVQTNEPTPAEGFVDEPRVRRHGTGPADPGTATECASVLRRSDPAGRCVR